MMDARWRSAVLHTFDERDRGVGRGNGRVSTKFARAVVGWQEKQDTRIAQLERKLAEQMEVAEYWQRRATKAEGKLRC